MPPLRRTICTELFVNMRMDLAQFSAAGRYQSESQRAESGASLGGTSVNIAVDTIDEPKVSESPMNSPSPVTLGTPVLLRDYEGSVLPGLPCDRSLMCALVRGPDKVSIVV